MPAPGIEPQTSKAASLPITTTVSVCSAKDILVWKTASKYLLRNVKSQNYVLIVPDHEVEIFAANTPTQFHVMGESPYIGSLKERLKTAIPKDRQNRLGWYLQQFIKLSAIRSAKDEEIILLWDADTVPLKQLSFIEESAGGGRLRYYQGGEYHHPYFDFINSFLGLSRNVDNSFIAQCFVIKGSWAKEFFDYIEARHHKNWIEALLENINFNEGSGFSEYETLGTFLSHKHKQDICAIDAKWLRHGNRLIGSVENIDHPVSKLLLKRYDFVSFESWDEPFRIIPKQFRKLFAKLFTRGTQ